MIILAMLGVLCWVVPDILPVKGENLFRTSTILEVLGFIFITVAIFATMKGGI